MLEDHTCSGKLSLSSPFFHSIPEMEIRRD